MNFSLAKYSQEILFLSRAFLRSSFNFTRVFIKGIIPMPFKLVANEVIPDTGLRMSLQLR